MIARALILAAAALSLASCGSEKPPIECDFDGMIVIPANATTDQKVDYSQRNLALAEARAAAAAGETIVYDKTRLAKARGCP
jgi:hypothetical protein